MFAVISFNSAMLILHGIKFVQIAQKVQVVQIVGRIQSVDSR
jgi:hypothetical protein